MRKFHCNRLVATFLGGLAILSTTADQSSAKVATKVKTTYFEVAGTTPTQLNQSIRNILANGDAETRWTVNTTHSWGNSGSKCKITQVNIRMSLEVVLPKLKDGVTLTPPIQAKWDKFVAKLASHENDHVALYKSAAGELDRKLKSFANPCRTMKRDSDALVHRGYRHMQKINDDYDNRVEHARLY